MLLFIDIETVPEYENFDELSPVMQKYWQKKAQYINPNEDVEDNPQHYYEKSVGIFAEYSKVLCIGLGYWSVKTGDLKTTAIIHEDEKQVLEEFSSLLDTFRKHTPFYFCGHNIKEFDLPFLCRRFTIKQMKLPPELNLAGLKPWENHHVDTMDLWRFGEYKRYTSLDLLASILHVSSSKQDMDGSQVSKVYYQDKDLERIKTYCIGDVKTTAEVYKKLTNATPKK